MADLLIGSGGTLAESSSVSESVGFLVRSSIQTTESSSIREDVGSLVWNSIQTSQLGYYYSGSGTAVNPQLSVGGAISATQIAGGVQDNVWQDVTTLQAANGVDSYSCIYVKNSSPTTTWTNVILWVDSQPVQGTVFAGVDSAPVGNQAASSCSDNLHAPGVANGGSGPSVTFTSALTKALGVSLGWFLPGSYRAIWLWRHIPSGTTAGSDAISIRCEGDTL